MLLFNKNCLRCFFEVVNYMLCLAILFLELLSCHCRCSVCEKSHDPHMMALCDTCNKHYHISCLDPPLSKVSKKTSKWGW